MALEDIDSDDLISTLGATWALPPKGSGTRAYAPAVLARLERAIAQGKHERHGKAVRKMMTQWRAHLREHVSLLHRVRSMDMEANTLVSTPYDAVTANGSSTLCTLTSPWSGKDFIIGDVLVPAELQPRGRFIQLDFFGIDMAKPSTSSATVSYGANGGGLSGTPTQQGLDFTTFYQNKTGPRGPRHFRPWTGYVFHSDAKIIFQIFNPDTINARSYDFVWLMKSDPCMMMFNRTGVLHPRDPLHRRRLSRLLAAVIGMNG